MRRHSPIRRPTWTTTQTRGRGTKRYSNALVPRDANTDDRQDQPVRFSQAAELGLYPARRTAVAQSRAVEHPCPGFISAAHANHFGDRSDRGHAHRGCGGLRESPGRRPDRLLPRDCRPRGRCDCPRCRPMVRLALAGPAALLHRRGRWNAARARSRRKFPTPVRGSLNLPIFPRHGATTERLDAHVGEPVCAISKRALRDLRRYFTGRTTKKLACGNLPGPSNTVGPLRG